METGATVHLVLMIFLTPIAFGTMGAVLIWFFTQKSESQQADRIEKIWAHRADWSEPVCRRLINSDIAAGMSPEMVRLAWGEPARIETPSDEAQTWVYPTRQSVSRVSFAGEVVTAVEGAAPTAAKNNTVWVYIAMLFALAFVVSVITLVVIFWVR